MILYFIPSVGITRLMVPSALNSILSMHTWLETKVILVDAMIDDVPFIRAWLLNH